MKVQTLGTLHCACGQAATHTLVAKGVKWYPYRKGEAFVACDTCLASAMEGPVYLYIVKA
jgi:hypothetical protein